MTVKEYIKENELRYTVIDFKCGEVQYDTANGFTSDTTNIQDISAMNMDINNACIDEMGLDRYLRYIGLRKESFDYNESDVFLVIVIV